uniref:Uncharacterized protein n=1 Tax=Chromera velia CCMP2878 TaxID=1169474 RepID=A0A0G4HHI9_9ALVE|eukprot:Cvel_27653.t1-p1 / transcript=Cvel_27653.t1 / gene=Cvel_27653 / organism=Chromera_velia_CCMP2878 / gene_product=hypothetical protein / transcript_product=hypothetical protein / location=Cvel_scaffold3484:6653-9535(-) / protein_length=69 / sequence_SO=supercontig / SO=protein_coding / is_pseudo=false
MVRYPAFNRFATGDMLYDWDILDVNHGRLQHAPDPERRKATTTFPVGVEQFQKVAKSTSELLEAWKSGQ